VNNEPTWATGTRSKHWREAATILAELLDAAYFADKCSANERIEPTWKQAHSRPLYVWRVVDRALLASRIGIIRDLLGVGVEANGQEKLAI